jgi:hypothetical protein
MGTERDTVYEGPCICGKGKFRIDYCNPDHGWPTSTPFWYELFIKCQACDRIYELQHQGNHIVVVEKAEILKKKHLSDESDKRWKLLLDTSEVKKVVKDFILLLESQRSIAAIHRLLTSAGIEHSSISTFRKSWRGSQDLVKHHLYYFNLPNIMKLVGNNSSTILNEIHEIKTLSKDSESSSPFVGEPIYKTT